VTPAQVQNIVRKAEQDGRANAHQTSQHGKQVGEGRIVAENIQ